MTLQEICERLRTKYRHHELWLDHREWPFPPPHPYDRQPIVISCSGRCLATYEGISTGWSFFPTQALLHFNETLDFFNLRRNAQNFLNDARITALLDEEYRFKDPSVPT